MQRPRWETFQSSSSKLEIEADHPHPHLQGSSTCLFTPQFHSRAVDIPPLRFSIIKRLGVAPRSHCVTRGGRPFALNFQLFPTFLGPRLLRRWQLSWISRTRKRLSGAAYARGYISRHPEQDADLNLNVPTSAPSTGRHVRAQLAVLPDGPHLPRRSGPH